MPVRTAFHDDNDHTTEAVLAAYSGGGGRMQVGATISSDEDYDWLAVELQPSESVIVVAAKYHLDGWHFVRVEHLPGRPTPLLHFKRQRPPAKNAPPE